MATAINHTREYTLQLKLMVHSKRTLRDKGFVLEPLNEAELAKKLRCVRCNKRDKVRRPDLRDEATLAYVKFVTDDFKDHQLRSALSTHGELVSCYINRKKNCALLEYISPAACQATIKSSPITVAGNVIVIEPRRLQADASGGANATQGRGHGGSEAQKDLQDADEKPRNPVCRWHSGVVHGNFWSCCRRYVFTTGCQTADAHDVPPAVTSATVARHQLEPTPRSDPNDPNPKYIAVAIDCEMGTSTDGNSELIRVTLIEYFSGSVLLDTLVWPDVPMAHYNTRYSGVSAAAMHTAYRNGTCLVGGAAAARAAVWWFVNDQTIVVGHDVRNDFTALRWAHSVVVDSLVVEEEARAWEKEVERRRRVAEGEDVEEEDGDKEGNEDKKPDKPKEPGLSLKAVSKLRLGRDIQIGAHDSFEDALASRDIVHYHVVANMY